MPLYHVSYKNYNIGDTILPGDWGNVIKSLNSLNPRAWLDLYLEQLRIIVNNGGVSRLDCIYAFNNATNAESFALSRPGAKIYELSVPNGTNTSTHNFKVISYFGGYAKDLPEALLINNQSLLQQYWTAGAGANWNAASGHPIGYVEEVLIDGVATVVNIF